MERVSLNQQLNIDRKRTDMRYASPDGTRPNPELVKRAQQNFIRQQRHPTPPSPSTLPLPSPRLLTRTKSRSKSKSKSPKAITIQGRNRRWTVKTHQKKATPHNNNTGRGIKIKNIRHKKTKQKIKTKSNKYIS